MTDTRKLYQEVLDASWAESLLSAASTARTTPVREGLSVYDRLVLARAELSAAVQEATEALAENPLTLVVAGAGARRVNRRGTPSIVVRGDGSIFLEVHYMTKQDERSVRRWESQLPTLAELRQQAKQLGLDPKPYGRKRSALFKAIQEAKASTPSKKMFRTSQAISPITVLETDPD